MPDRGQLEAEHREGTGLLDQPGKSAAIITTNDEPGNRNASRHDDRPIRPSSCTPMSIEKM